MITIMFLDKKIRNGLDNTPVDYHVDIEITDGVDAYSLGVGGVPLSLDDAGIQLWLDSRADKLWSVAQRKAIPADVLNNIKERALLKALVLLILDEINVLRTDAGLAVRTKQQLVDALKTKLRE